MSHLQGYSSLQPFPKSGFIKPDSELRGLLDRIYRASDASAEEIIARRRRSAPVRGVPVYVMLPLDTVWLASNNIGNKPNPILLREKAIEVGLDMLVAAGVEGVMIDVWWNFAEHAGPGTYDFSAYKKLFEQVAARGLKVQAVMSFHAAGGNVGDTCTISLPPWVLEAGEAMPDIFYTDAAGNRNKECLSLGCDEIPVLPGPGNTRRTPLKAYSDFIKAFTDEFSDIFGTVISEVTVGLGPAGELRYPSYPEGDGRWRFPGVGEFQCYDAFMLSTLSTAAHAIGRPEWGFAGPHDAGHYNSNAEETGFFSSRNGSWETEYGDFFLRWYSEQLTAHADRVLGAARKIIRERCRPRVIKEARELSDGGTLYVFEPAVKLGVKLAGVHWWFKSRSHAAELTAGYYNTRQRDGYRPILKVLGKHDAEVSFTCVEMRDCEHPEDARCSPEGLLQQMITAAAAHGVPLAGENALQRYDQYAFDKIAESAFGQSVMAGRMEKLTFLRMGDMMVDNWDAFSAFLKRLTVVDY